MTVIAKWLAASTVGLAAAQYFPPAPEGLKIVHSKHEEGVKISYKEVRYSFCHSRPFRIPTLITGTIVVVRQAKA